MNSDGNNAEGVQNSTIINWFQGLKDGLRKGEEEVMTEVKRKKTAQNSQQEGHSPSCVTEFGEKRSPVEII